jgi:hypothetical protein
MADIIDFFELNIAKAIGEGGASLKALLEGDRFKKMACNLSGAIQGPFFYGSEPSYVDFLLCQAMDWQVCSIFIIEIDSTSYLHLTHHYQHSYTFFSSGLSLHNS